jgi:hypothetical protein
MLTLQAEARNPKPTTLNPTTGVDSLWSNTPVLTLPGREFAGRVAAGLVTAVSPLQRNVMITRTSDDYAEVLRAIASSPNRLAKLQIDLDSLRRGGGGGGGGGGEGQDGGRNSEKSELLYIYNIKSLCTDF